MRRWRLTSKRGVWRGEPQLSFMAQAYGALMQHRLGRTCEAGRTFQYLGAGSDAPLPPRVREPYEAFERSLAEAPMDAETMACALQMTSNHRRIGVCPSLNVRIPFAHDRADLDMAYRTEAENLAEALHRVHDGSYRYRLVGHTDSRGSAAYNQNLSGTPGAERARLHPGTSAGTAGKP